MKKSKCHEGECWCKSAGGNTCGYSEKEACDPDECYDRNNCPGDGYWCDDTDNNIGGDKDHQLSKSKCLANQCWCVSAGGNTCGYSEKDQCDPDECDDRNNCPGDGYWCDDTDSNVGGENEPQVNQSKCLANECWCVSSGGYTCGYSEKDPCDPDECDDRNNCPGDGYWCDDTDNTIEGDKDSQANQSKCLANECWCVSAGGNTCGYSEKDPCDPDECDDRNNCPGDGYWCDDTNITDEGDNDHQVNRAKCLANECWCVSAGGNTCGYSENDPCDPDECDDKNNCPGDGYWCDDAGKISGVYKD